MMNIDLSSKYHSDHRSVLKPDVENVRSKDLEPTISPEEGPLTRTEDTVSAVGTNDAANLTRSYRDVVTSGIYCSDQYSSLDHVTCKTVFLAMA